MRLLDVVRREYKTAATPRDAIVAIVAPLKMGEAIIEDTTRRAAVLTLEYIDGDVPLIVIWIG